MLQRSSVFGSLSAMILLGASLVGCGDPAAPPAPAIDKMPGPMEKGKMPGPMESGKMEGGSMESGRMESGKMESGKMESGKMESAPK